MHQQTPGSRLRPLPADLAPEARDLAVFLRERFSEVGMGVRAYARLHYLSASEVSRFLQGSRIPDGDFVRDLVEASAGPGVASPQRSPMSLAELQTEGLELRMKALRLRNKRQAEVEALRQELRVAENEVHLAAVRERALTEQLSREEAESRHLIEQVHLLEIEQGRLASGALSIEQSEERRELSLLRSSVEVEVIDLRAKLTAEKAVRIAAEQRCGELKEQLDEANLLLAMTGGPVIDASIETSVDKSTSYLSIKRAEWGGASGLVVVPSVTYIGPVYFGIIYGLLPATAVFLRSLTLCGPLISAFFIYRERREGRPGWLMRLIVLIIVLFFIGFLLGHFGGFIRSF